MDVARAASPKEATSGPRLRPPDLPYLARLGIFLAVYFVTARLGLLMDAVSGFATTVWPPTGISLAVLALFGYRLWPGIALGAFLVNVSAGAPVLTACGMAIGNTLEAVVGAYLLRRFSGSRGSLDRIQGVVGFVVLVAGLSTMVSATIGVMSGWLGGVIPPVTVGKAWLTWWLGDALGDLILAPLLLVWTERSELPFTPRRLAEASALLASLVTVTLLVFGAGLTPHQAIFLQPYVLLPFLIWAALRFWRHGTVTATFVVTTMAIWRTAAGFGPFARGSVNESLLLLQAFMGIVAVTMLVFAAGMTERRRAQAELRLAHAGLEAGIARRTEQLAEMNRALAAEIAERRRAEESLQQLSTRLLRIQDEERQRLARELHDSTAQGLAALSMNLAVVRGCRGALDARAQKALDESDVLADRCSREIRSLSYLLHPPLLEEIGLTAALRWCAEGFARRSGIAVEVDLPADFGRLPMEVETALFRIVQECLTNVQRHSGSPTARIQLVRKPQGVALEVQDEGRGMPAGILDRRDAVELLGVGLLGMRERVRQLGGRLQIESNGEGSRVQVEISLGSQGS